LKLPGGDRAVVPPGKLTGYLLNNAHPTGSHKARVFRAALGLTAEDAFVLEAALLKAAREGDAELVAADGHGVRYRVTFVLDYSGRSAIVRSGWLVPNDGGPPQLSTAVVRRP
jgi:hypothetical protein